MLVLLVLLVLLVNYAVCYCSPGSLLVCYNLCVSELCIIFFTAFTHNLLVKKIQSCLCKRCYISSGSQSQPSWDTKPNVTYYAGISVMDECSYYKQSYYCKFEYNDPIKGCNYR